MSEVKKQFIPTDVRLIHAVWATPPGDEKKKKMVAQQSPQSMHGPQGASLTTHRVHPHEVHHSSRVRRCSVPTLEHGQSLYYKRELLTIELPTFNNRELASPEILFQQCLQSSSSVLSLPWNKRYEFVH